MVTWAMEVVLVVIEDTLQVADAAAVAVVVSHNHIVVVEVVGKVGDIVLVEQKENPSKDRLAQREDFHCTVAAAVLVSLSHLPL